MNLLAGISLRQLRAFTAVAATGSFTAAARTLHQTPSASSLLVRDLERVLGVRLFDRTTRQVALTTAGSEFVQQARKVLADLERAVVSSKELEQKMRGTVRIACTPLYAATLVPRLVARYVERYPAIHVEILDSLHQQALDRLARGEADLCIAPQRPTSPDIAQQPLIRDRIALFCLPGHALARRPTATWKQVMREPFVTLTQDFTVRLQADLLRHSDRLVLEPTHQASFITSALGLVRAGLGVTAQPLHAELLAAPFGLVVRRLAGPVVYRQISLFTSRRASLSPAAESFRDLATTAIRS